MLLRDSANVNRPARKRVHAALHTCAAILVALALLAVFKSHTLKRPAKIPDLYSPHSWLGLATLSLGGLQYVLGFAVYLFPGAPLSTRVALGPVHRFLGQATFASGLATMAVGIQEKCTFAQLGKGLKGQALYSEMRLPALMQLVLLLLGLTTLYLHAPTAPVGGAYYPLRQPAALPVGSLTEPLAQSRPSDSGDDSNAERHRSV